MWNLFFQRDPYSASDVGAFAEKIRRANDEIIITAGQGRIVAGKVDALVVPRLFDRESVCQGDGRYHRFDFVKPVSAPAFDFERKIDLRRRQKLHNVYLATKFDRITE
jgi:hypothetical protein